MERCENIMQEIKNRKSQIALYQKMKTEKKIMQMKTGKQKLGNLPLILQIITNLIIFTLPMGVLLFVSAGTINWPMAWLFLSILVIGNIFVITHVSPDLGKERSQKHVDSKKWDQILVLLFFIIGYVILIIAGLDHRFGWTGSIPIEILLISALLVIIGYTLFIWAIVSNNFFSTVVRIQKDRGHVVVSNGPYRYIRHPGYAGVIIYTLFQSTMLGSYWALIPAIITVMIFFLRTFLEDNTLQEELPEYKDYTQIVRYRLIPGVW